MGEIVHTSRIKIVRENPKIIEKDLKKRGDKDRLTLLKTIIKNDSEWRTGLKKLEDLRRKRNIVTDEIAKLKKSGGKADAKIRDMKRVGQEIKTLEDRVQELQSLCRDGLMRLPNILHDSVPVGKDDHDNVPIKHWGKPPKFSFNAKNHYDVALGLGIIDGDRAAKTAGSGFYYLKGDLARLDYALQKFAVDFLV